MFTKESIERFYKDVESLNLKHPVKAIHEATKYNKGTISLYLNRKDEPSENFLKAFYNKFGESLKNGAVRPTEAQQGAKSENKGVTTDLVDYLTTELIEARATLKVLVYQIAPLIAKKKHLSDLDAFLQLQKDISAEVERLKALDKR